MADVWRRSPRGFGLLALSKSSAKVGCGRCLDEVRRGTVGRVSAGFFGVYASHHSFFGPSAPSAMS